MLPFRKPEGILAEESYTEIKSMSYYCTIMAIGSESEVEVEWVLKIVEVRKLKGRYLGGRIVHWK